MSNVDSQEALDKYIGAKSKKPHSHEDSFFRALESKVDEILDCEDWVMDLDLEHLDLHVRRSTPELWVVARLLAKYVKAEEKAKRSLKKAEANAIIWAKQEHGSQPKHILDAYAALDDGVDSAHEHYIEVMEVRRALEGLHDALRRKNDKIPGLQGRANFIFQMEAKGQY